MIGGQDIREDVLVIEVKLDFVPHPTSPRSRAQRPSILDFKTGLPFGLDFNGRVTFWIRVDSDGALFYHYRHWPETTKSFGVLHARRERKALFPITEITTHCISS